MSISDVVSVSITVRDAVPSEDGFGIPALFVSVGGAFVGWKTYSADSDGLTAMLADGITLGSAAYKAGSAFAAQNPKIEKFKVYARTTHAAQVEKHTPTVTTPGYVYSVEVSDGTTTGIATHTNGGSETANTIATALALAISALAVGAVTGAHAGSDGFYTVQSGSTTRFYTKNVSAGITMLDTSTDGGIATDLAAAIALDDDWFGIALDTTSKAETVAAAAFAEANEKIFVALTKDTDVANSVAGNVALTVGGSGYNFTLVFYETDVGSFPQCGILSRELSQDPGSSSWHGKKITGTTPDAFPQSSLDHIRAANAMPYVAIKGIPFTFDGKAASGRFIDITIGVTWLKAIIQDSILALIASLEKIPFTNEGISMVVAVVSQCLHRAEAVKLIASGWVVTAPDVADVDPGDKANRLLADVKFTAVLQGAIHKVIVKGTVSV